VIFRLRSNNLEDWKALNKGGLTIDKTCLKEPEPFVVKWLEVIEDGSIEAILVFLESID
jgi:hypothetical protein